MSPIAWAAGWLSGTKEARLTQESRIDMGAFSSSITAEVNCGGKSVVAGGTLFGNNMPRLIRLGDYRLETYMDGNLLVFTHSDVPGIIGRIGSIFGEHNVNIAQMSVGRAGDAPGGDAIAMMNLDSLPPQAALDEALKVKGIKSIKIIPLPPANQLPPWLQG
jgi:D-3-phosphoglycerate dehydrogenase